MNSQTMDGLFISPGSARSTAQFPTSSQNVIELAVASAILTAVTAGLFTATVAVGSTPSADMQYVSQMLNQAGYTARVTGTNLVVNW